MIFLGLSRIPLPAGQVATIPVSPSFAKGRQIIFSGCSQPVEWIADITRCSSLVAVVCSPCPASLSL